MNENTNNPQSPFGGIDKECVFRRETEESRVDEYAPDILPWLYDSGKADFDLLFEHRPAAHEQLIAWMKCPSSAFSIRCFTLLFVRERPLGGFIGIAGKELLRRVQNDTLNLLRQADPAKRPVLLDRLRLMRDSVPPIVEVDFYLRALGLAPELRHKGLGRVMMARYLAEGEQAGFLRFRLEVESGNEPAVRLYEKTGFRVIAETVQPNTGVRFLSMILWK